MDKDMSGHISWSVRMRGKGRLILLLECIAIINKGEERGKRTAEKDDNQTLCFDYSPLIIWLSID